MVVWINGPYGVGKSTLAEQLVQDGPKGFVFDPETVGNAVRDTLPKEMYKGALFEQWPLHPRDFSRE